MADILKRYTAEFVARHPGQAPPHVQSTLAKLSLCRTPALGGRWYRCDACDRECVLANSCGDRHCPQCGGAQRADWLDKTSQLLLPGVDYYQVVFTIPDKLSSLALGNRRPLFNLLFRSAWTALKSVIEHEQGFEPAALMVLHTWNQKLDAHVHVHAVVPGGGPSLPGGRWIPSRCRDGTTSGPWLVHADALRAAFRREFLDGLKRLHRRGELKLTGEWSALADAGAFAEWLKPLEEVSWVTYIEPPPFPGASPDHVLKYLARYLTGGPISDRRLVSHEQNTVTFSARRGQTKGGDARDVEAVTLPGHEFVRRWAMHILPKGFVKTRRFGGFSNRHRRRYLDQCRGLLGRPETASSDSHDGGSHTATAAGGGSDSDDLGSAETRPHDEPPRCPTCERPLRLVARTVRPGWARVMSSPHRPHWYRHLQLRPPHRPPRADDG